MRFLFIVQGEGRGHMTQSIALFNTLQNHGHEVCRVVVGRSARREIPQFFSERISVPISQVDSPNFVADKHNKSVSIRKTVANTLSHLGVYRRSIKELDEIVRLDGPDVIINFYDFIGGVYAMVKRPKIKIICIAHQYLAGHSTFEFPQGRWLDRVAMRMGNKITAFRANRILALAFQELPDEPGLDVVPPLLREEVKSLSVTQDGHLLVYMLNHGYSAQIDEFHRQHPSWKIHCFWDKKDEPKRKEINENLIYNQLDGELFLKYMSSCRGFLTTAGFESVCEAMYLGKPVMMMPVEGHYEQACNALDASKVGAGIQSKVFDLERLIDYLPNHKTEPQIFRQWADRSEEIFVQKLTQWED